MMKAVPVVCSTTAVVRWPNVAQKHNSRYQIPRWTSSSPPIVSLLDLGAVRSKDTDRRDLELGSIDSGRVDHCGSWWISFLRQQGRQFRTVSELEKAYDGALLPSHPREVFKNGLEMPTKARSSPPQPILASIIENDSAALRPFLLLEYDTTQSFYPLARKLIFEVSSIPIHHRARLTLLYRILSS